MKEPKYNFGDIVVVEDTLIGVVVKSWERLEGGGFQHEVYVRSFNGIVNYEENNIERFVYDKELPEEEG